MHVDCRNCSAFNISPSLSYVECRKTREIACHLFSTLRIRTSAFAAIIMVSRENVRDFYAQPSEQITKAQVLRREPSAMIN